jgi:hypothetical protein
MRVCPPQTPLSLKVKAGPGIGSRVLREISSEMVQVVDPHLENLADVLVEARELDRDIDKIEVVEDVGSTVDLVVSAAAQQAEYPERSEHEQTIRESSHDSFLRRVGRDGEPKAGSCRLNQADRSARRLTPV